MKIDGKTICSFLEELRMNQVESVLLRFDSDGLRVNTISSTQTNMASALLHASAFTDYEAKGNAGVESLSTLIKVFKRMGKEIEFNIEGNLMTMKGGKKQLQFEFVDEKFIEENTYTLNLEYGTSARVPVDTIHDFLGDVKDANTTDDRTNIATVNDGVKLYNSGKYHFTHYIDSEGTKGGYTLEFGVAFNQLMKNIKDGELILHFGSDEEKGDYPLKVERNTDTYSITFFTVPLSEAD